MKTRQLAWSLVAAVLFAIVLMTGALFQSNPAFATYGLRGPGSGQEANHPALTGETWFALSNGLSSDVFAMAANGSDIYVGGAFNGICTSSACSGANTKSFHVAKWDGAAWTGLGNGLDGTVRAIAVSGSTVYAGGDFVHVCGNKPCNSAGTTVNHIAKWDGATWSALGNGADGTVNAILINGSDVYFGGNFANLCGDAGCTTPNKTKVNHIAKWTGTAWVALDHGVSDAVNALALNAGVVYAGGGFTSACGNNACSTSTATLNYVGQWNGTTWSGLSFGLIDAVNALAFKGSTLYAGGNFSAACGDAGCLNSNIKVNHLASWNGSAWSAMSNGVGGNVYGLASDGTLVYAGGNFVSVCGNDACDAGNATVNRMVSWNGSTFAALVKGADAQVDAVLANAGDVYAGGAFTQTCGNNACNSGNLQVNRVARYGLVPPTATPTPTRTNTPTITLTPTMTFTPSLTPTATATVVCVAKPAQPTLLGPADKKIINRTRVTLRWNPAVCASIYKVRVKDNVTLKTVDKANGNILQYKTIVLTQGKTYRWFVKGCNTFGCTKSAVRTFTIQ